MVSAALHQPPRGLARILGLRRVLILLGVSGLLGLIISPSFTTTPADEVMAREMAVGLAALLAFGVFEQWPARLPPWVARWFLQVAAVAFVVPFAALAVYLTITYGESVPFYKSQLRLN